MSFFRFEDPWVLLLILLLPFCVLLLRGRKKAVFHYSSIARLKSILPAGTQLLASVPLVLRLLAIALLIVALARPQEGRKSTEILSAGVDIMLAIDTSVSMQAMDFMKDGERIDRLQVVKDVVAEFIANRPYDRLGMVVFGEEAFTQCPLTLDHDILLAFLRDMKIGQAGNATAIGSAIGISVKRLKDLQAKSRVIILLTDGRNTAGNITPAQAASIAKQFGVKIHTIGVGTDGKAPFLVDSLFGKRYVYQDVEMDEKTLKDIADMTGGQYFRATDLDTLKKVYQQIDQLETSEVKTLDHSEYKELFPYFLVTGLSFFLLEILLTNTRLRRVP